MREFVDIDDIFERAAEEAEHDEGELCFPLAVTCKRCGAQDLAWTRVFRAQSYALTDRFGRRHVCKAAPEAFPLVPV